MLRTDMAVEFGKKFKTKKLRGEIERSHIKIDERFAKKVGRAAGEYITLETKVVLSGEKSLYPRLARALADDLALLTGDAKNVLVVGLGNPDMTADALGKMVTSRLCVTRAWQESVTKISCITPNVLGVTGIESADIVRGVVSVTRPDLVVAIDSLAGAAASRIAAAFQLCSAGITPGSGIGNHRGRIDEAAMGVPVVSIGVPLVVYASTIIEEAEGKEMPPYLAGLVVTPKDIDLLVSDCAEVIASAINLAFLGEDFKGLGA